MEDAATAEISRSQIWQWIRNPKGTLDDGRKVTLEMFRTLLGEELKKLSGARGAASLRYDEAAWLLDQLVSSDEFIDFLTGPAYEIVTTVVAKEQVAA
jgi:malate synthase